jgi:hypothetical protein
VNTEYAVGSLRIRFESRARRRAFVALFYAAVAVICLVWCSFNPKQMAGAWVLSGCMILGVALSLVFSWISGDMRIPGDEREMYRRGQAYCKAHSFFAKLVVAGLMGEIYLRGRNPISPLLPLALRGGMVSWTVALLMAACLVYLTLPQAILLWTEPDMEELRAG